MPLIRGHHAFDGQFTQIPNSWLRDSRLSLDTRGLLAQLLSHAPGWKVSQENLAKANGVSRDTIRRMIGELVEYGYLSVSEKQSHNERGHLIGFTYTTKDPSPLTSEPLWVEPTKAEPTKVNTPHKKNISKEQNNQEKQIKNKREIYSEEFEMFWAKYPRHEGSKSKANKAYWHAVGGNGSTTLFHALDIWLKHPDKADRKFWPYLERWLRDERFKDELPATGGINKSSIKGYFE